MVVTFMSIVTYMASLVLRKNLNLKKSFQITLHTITFAQTAAFLQGLLLTGNFPSLFNLAILGATLIAVYSLKPLSKTSV
jgi:hypothetical protein